MPCYQPIKAYRALEKNPSGKRNLVFNPKHALIEGGVIEIPCGGCIGCKIDRARDWAIRCHHESSMHQANSFITLTFSDEHLPPDYGLHVRTWQLFMKRLRRSLHANIRFFACGEYSDPPNYRPHYHALLFGYQFPDLVTFTIRKGHKIYTSKKLDQLWGFGHCWIGNVTYQSAGYVSRYVMKKQNGDADNTVAHYTRVHPITKQVHQVKREFCVQSRRPGIGATWFAKYKNDAFPSDFVVVDGRKLTVPRYYNKKLEQEELEKYKRARKLQSHSPERRANSTPERLKVRQEVKSLQLQRLKRDLHS